GELQPANAAAHVNAAYTLVQAAKFEQAEAAVRSSLQRFPDEPDLLVNLAQIQRATHRSREALSTMERCITLAPQHPGYRVTHALVHLDLGEIGEGLAELDAIIRDHPDFPDAHRGRAPLLLSMRQHAAGWSDYLWRPERARWLAAEGLPFTPAPTSLDEIRGKPVLLVGEQGLGGRLFFSRLPSWGGARAGSHPPGGRPPPARHSSGAPALAASKGGHPHPGRRPWGHDWRGSGSLAEPFTFSGCRPRC